MVWKSHRDPWSGGGAATKQSRFWWAWREYFSLQSLLKGEPTNDRNESLTILAPVMCKGWMVVLGGGGTGCGVFGHRGGCAQAVRKVGKVAEGTAHLKKRKKKVPHGGGGKVFCERPTCRRARRFYEEFEVFDSQPHSPGGIGGEEQ